MKISIPKENRKGETRVAASPEVVKKFVSMGFSVTIESGAGLNAGFTDEIFKDAGAEIAADTKSTLENADLVFKIQRLMTSNDSVNEISMCKKDSMILSIMRAHIKKEPNRWHLRLKKISLRKRFSKNLSMP